MKKKVLTGTVSPANHRHKKDTTYTIDSKIQTLYYGLLNRISFSFIEISEITSGKQYSKW